MIAGNASSISKDRLTLDHSRLVPARDHKKDTSRGKERPFCHGLFLSLTGLRWLLKPPLLPASISLDRGDEARRPGQLRKLGCRAS